jgi:hypothetical protein
MAFDAKYASECVKLEPTALEEEFVRYTADLAYWGQQLAEVKQAESLVKLSRDTTQADLDVGAREALAGDKKPTEAMISAWVQKHPAMVAAEKECIGATYEVDRVRAVWEALRSKRDMLVGLGAQQRAEMQHEPSIKVDF